jgi:hypothetical protein
VDQWQSLGRRQRENQRRSKSRRVEPPVLGDELLRSFLLHLSSRYVVDTLNNKPNGKQPGPQRNSVDIKVSFPKLFPQNRVGNGNDDISSGEHFENSKTKRDTYLQLELFIFV